MTPVNFVIVAAVALIVAPTALIVAIVQGVAGNLLAVLFACLAAFFFWGTLRLRRARLAQEVATVGVKGEEA